MRRDYTVKDYEDECAEALENFQSETKADKELAMMKFQNLRDYANKLAYELAHVLPFNTSPEAFMKQALKAQEYEDVMKTLDEMADVFEGVWLDWEWAPADEFWNAYERVEVYVGDYKLP